MRKQRTIAIIAALTALFIAGCGSSSKSTREDTRLTRDDSTRIQQNAEETFNELDRETDGNAAASDSSAAPEAAAQPAEAASAASADQPVAATESGAAVQAAVETTVTKDGTTTTTTVGTTAEYSEALRLMDSPETPDAEKLAQAQAAVAAEAQAAPAASGPGTCTVGEAPGKRQVSESMAQALCGHAQYELQCADGHVDIDVVAVGNPSAPWFFKAHGCGMEALYQTFTGAIRLVNVGKDSKAADGTCQILPYFGRQVSPTAQDILCERSRTDLQCPDGGLRIIVLRVGPPWDFAVEGCGYSVRYQMVGNNIIRLD